MTISAFDVNSPAKSVSAVINKAIKLFSTAKIDVAPFIEQAYAAIVEVILIDQYKHIPVIEFILFPQICMSYLYL